MYSYFKSCCHITKHVDNELVEFMPVGEQEYEEIIKEYVEEILV